MSSASGLWTGYLDAGHLTSHTGSFPGFLVGASAGTSGHIGTFTGHLAGRWPSGLFTGFVQGPVTLAAQAVFTGFIPAGGVYRAATFPGFIYNGYTAASGLFTGHTSGYGVTAGAVPASGLFTGYLKRTVSTSFHGIVWAPFSASGLFPAVTWGRTGASGLFPGVIPQTEARTSGLFTGYTNGY